MMRDMPDWAKDRIFTDTWIVLGWMDRIRVLFGRKIHVDVFTNCENVPGPRLESTNRVWVENILPRKPEQGMAEVSRA